MNKEVNQKELQFHNERYLSEDSDRIKQKKYYDAVQVSAEVFKDKIEEAAAARDVLEYGCGEKSLLLGAVNNYKNYWAVDISDVAIEKLKEAHLTKKNVKFLVMSCEALDFGDEKFGLIFGSGILHHLNVEAAYSEISRALKKGGDAIFYEPLGHNLLINVYRKITPNARTDDEHPLMMKDIKLAEKYFENVSVEYYGFLTLAGAFLPRWGLIDFIRRTLNASDKWLSKHVSWLNKYYWIAIISLKK